MVRAQFRQDSDDPEDQNDDDDLIDNAPTRPTHFTTPSSEILDRVNTSASRPIRDPAERPPPSSKISPPLVVPRPVLDHNRRAGISGELTTDPATSSSASGMTLRLRQATARASVILAGVAGIVLGAVGLRAFDRATAPPLASYVATSANELMIDAMPPSAVVISERDGLILGPVPLAMMVPSGIDVAVLITARGYEPQRLVLPDRGSISTRLTRLPPNADACAVDLPTSAGARYEGIEADIVSGGNFRVRGAAVVRIPGEGAWAVRCPPLGGGHLTVHRQTLPMVSLAIDAPIGSTVFMNGNEVGTAPLRRPVRGAFTEITLREGDKTMTRWIPTTEPVAVSMRPDWAN
ncbi:MAG: hypothetical protein AAF449_20105 [Myxococcota bacterium]